MATEYAVIVAPALVDNPFTDKPMAFGYWTRVGRGTIHSPDLGPGPVLWRPSARWAKAAGDRWIAREHAREARKQRREQKARRVTGYEED